VSGPLRKIRSWGVEGRHDDPPERPEVEDHDRIDDPDGYAVASLALGVAGVSFIIAPVISYPLPIALGAAGTIIGWVGIHYRGGAFTSLYILALPLCLAAIVTGIVGYEQVENVRSALDELAD
jgi:hypothetical protein